MRRPISQESISQWASEHRMEFRDVLSLAVREEFLSRIQGSPYEGYLLLSGEDILPSGSIRLVYTSNELLRDSECGPGSPFSPELARQILSLFQKPTRLFEHECSLSEDFREIEISAQVDGMYVPVTIFLKDVNIMSYPEKRHYVRTLFPDYEFTLLIYSPALAAAEDLLNIMMSMELLSDMTPYLSLYERLLDTPFDGVRVSAGLLRLCDEKEYIPSKEQAEIFAGYGKNNFMATKWKRFLRGRRRKSLSWSEVFSLISKFVLPIWEAVSEEELYSGDWIPEAGRFLG